MGQVKVVNIIPQSLSGETNQDSEPNLAVNPETPDEIVATAFTPNPLGGSNAPIFLSTDGGDTWSLRSVVPGAGSTFATKDISIAFATAGGRLYASILRGDSAARQMQILRATSATSTATMDLLSQRTGPDQPWVVAQTDGAADRVWVGNNAVGLASQSATVDATADGRAASPTFARSVPEQRTTSGQDGPPVRLAAHSDGTVYAAFVRWTSFVANNLNFDVVVTRDDSWGTAANGFNDLVDSRDSVVGVRVADALYAIWNEDMGQERLGADLAIAVDPRNSRTVWVAWGYRRGGAAAGARWSVDVACSTDRGNNWAPIRRTIVGGKNPTLAVNSRGQLGFLYQQFTGTEWVTTLEVTSDAFATAAETHVLHRAPSDAPGWMFKPYLGDYARLVSVGRNFYGIFSGSNAADATHFPSGVSYQRNADWATQQLLGTDGVTTVSTSIDPFFFRWRPDLGRPVVGPVRPIVPRGISPRTTITPRRPIIPRTTITPVDPVIPIVPIDPIGPIAGGGRGPVLGGEPETRGGTGVPSPEPPEDLDL